MMNRASTLRYPALKDIHAINDTGLITEMWLLIFAMLSPRDLIRLSGVSRLFYYLTNDKIVWNKHLAEQGTVHDSHCYPNDKFQFFAINRTLASIVCNPDHPIIGFMLKHKTQLSSADRNFIRIITSPVSDRKTSREQLTKTNRQLFDYFQESPFIFCTGFVSIPVVRTYVTSLTRSGGFTQDLDRYFSQPALMNIPHHHATACLQRLLLCCLLAELDEQSFGKTLSAYHISESYQFPQLASLHGVITSPVTCAQDLYALSRIFIRHQHAHIDRAFVLQFYNSYQNFLGRAGNHEILISELSKEVSDMCPQLSL
ncbi:hypothetical protein AQUSIP_09400 [Aquicella siphonis]|uniref:F-box domain-containing protein n=1 Tax=Aquicella siphonis TaxID=254247 RepID=A0A5E4PF91_9COXI|nr:F-box protein [Aquicella siphonis]VVC75650.1 hypothetical protein AQUSIP_09400 [Aquicella siphonis]